MKINNDFLKVAKTLSTKSPDKKISASAAMDNSQKKATNVAANLNVNLWAPSALVFDLKFCLFYIQKKLYYEVEGELKFFQIFSLLENAKDHTIFVVD